jgi:hypothetical protein
MVWLLAIPVSIVALAEAAFRIRCRGIGDGHARSHVNEGRLPAYGDETVIPFRVARPTGGSCAAMRAGGRGRLK